MKNKKIVLIIFILVALVQLYVPAKMIFNREDVLQTGKKYKFRTAPIDPNDPFRGKYITLGFQDARITIKHKEDWERDEPIFVTLYEDEYGFAKIKSILKEKPNSKDDFVKARVGYVSPNWDGFNKIDIDFSFNKLFMEETKAGDAEQIYRENNRFDKANTYALVSIKDGDAVLKDVFIDDVSIKEIVKVKQQTK